MPAPTAPGVVLTINEVAWLVGVEAANGRLTGGNRPPPGTGPDTDAQAYAVAIVMRESGGNTAAYRPASRNPLGGEDRGLWQINSKAHPNVADSTAYNAGAATGWAFRASSGFTDWGPWGIGPNSYDGRDRTYTLNLARARAAVAAPADPTAKLNTVGQLVGADGPPVQDDLDRVIDGVGSVLEWPALAADVLRRLLDAALWRRILIGAAGVLAVVLAVVLAARSSILPLPSKG